MLEARGFWVGLVVQATYFRHLIPYDMCIVSPHSGPVFWCMVDSLLRMFVASLYRYASFHGGTHILGHMAEGNRYLTLYVNFHLSRDLNGLTRIWIRLLVL
jgi:hypothetical protein